MFSRKLPSLRPWNASTVRVDCSEKRKIVGTCNPTGFSRGQRREIVVWKGRRQLPTLLGSGGPPDVFNRRVVESIQEMKTREDGETIMLLFFSSTDTLSICEWSESKATDPVQLWHFLDCFRMCRCFAPRHFFFIARKKSSWVSIRELRQGRAHSWRRIKLCFSRPCGEGENEGRLQ